MENDTKKKIPEKKLEKVTGGVAAAGAFDDIPTVDDHEYDPDTKGYAGIDPQPKLK